MQLCKNGQCFLIVCLPFNTVYQASALRYMHISQSGAFYYEFLAKCIWLFPMGAAAAALVISAFYLALFLLNKPSCVMCCGSSPFVY